MDKPASFVVPVGVVFEIEPDGLTIRNQGDIILHTTFGRPLKSVVSTEGSVEIHGDVEGGALAAAGTVTVGGSLTAHSVEAGGRVAIGGVANVPTIRAGGSVHITGDANVKSLHAGDSVEVSGNASGDGITAGAGLLVIGTLNVALVRGGAIELRGPVTARGVQGTSSVRLGGGRLQVDAIIAPSVVVDGKVSGRVTIIESYNELGPLGIKGGFRLADYAEMFGNPEAYLADRGLAPLGEAPASAEPATAREAESAPAEPAPAEPAVVDSAPATDAEAPAATEAADVVAAPVVAPPEEPAPAPIAPPSAGAALEVDIEEAEDASMQVAPAPMPAEHPLHRQLIDAVVKIAECYAGGELPPAVSHLMQLIESRAYDQVRAEITTIWSELLKFHQKKGMRIQHQVTTTFNTINSLVKKM